MCSTPLASVIVPPTVLEFVLWSLANQRFVCKSCVEKVHLDGELTHTHESYTGSTFNSLGVQGMGVSTVMLESVDLLSDEWISLLEVSFFFLFRPCVFFQ